MPSGRHPPRAATEAIIAGSVVRHTKAARLSRLRHLQLAPACDLTSMLDEAVAAFMAVLDRYTLADLLKPQTTLLPLSRVGYGRHSAQAQFSPQNVRRKSGLFTARRLPRRRIHVSHRRRPSRAGLVQHIGDALRREFPEAAEFETSGEVAPPGGLRRALVRELSDDDGEPSRSGQHVEAGEGAPGIVDGAERMAHSSVRAGRE